jgi:hypothetical protein
MPTVLYVATGFEQAKPYSYPDEIHADKKGNPSQYILPDGTVIHSDFVHGSEDTANHESRDRHVRLHRHISDGDLIGAFSVLRESDRIRRGMSRRDLEERADKDAERYNSWVKTLKHQWQSLTGRAPELAEVVASLKAMPALSAALKSADAKDFLVILEAQTRKAAKPQSESKAA